MIIYLVYSVAATAAALLILKASETAQVDCLVHKKNKYKSDKLRARRKFGGDLRGVYFEAKTYQDISETNMLFIFYYIL